MGLVADIECGVRFDRDVAAHMYVLFPEGSITASSLLPLY